MAFKRITFYTLLVVMLLLTSCRGKFGKVRKKGSFEEKYSAAMRYYNKKDYFHSSILFEDLLPLATGKKDAEKIELYYAYSQYYQKQYMLAAYHFKKFYETYARNEAVSEAMYMRGMCLYKMSAKSSLDQESTEDAIVVFQNYINSYPYDKNAKDVNEKIDQLQEKLEFKAYNNTKLYHKIGYYKAAIIAIDNYRVDYPDSHFNEELQFLKIESQYKLAKQSLETVTDDDGKIIHLKRQRLEDAKRFYYNFVDSYTSSKFSKDAESVFKNIELLLSNLE